MNKSVFFFNVSTKGLLLKVNVYLTHISTLNSTNGETRYFSFHSVWFEERLGK